MTRRRRYTGQIVCEFCRKVVGGSSKSGLFSNYNSHVLAAHINKETGAAK